MFLRAAPWCALPLLVCSCVCSDGTPTDRALPGDNPRDPNRDPAPPPRPKEHAFWDFVAAPEPTLLALWPQDPAAPQRKKRHLRTRQEDNVLIATNDGSDPYLSWHFDTPLYATLLSVEIEIEKPGRFQLFWQTLDCKVFVERCSSIQTSNAGSHSVEFVLSSRRALRGLRLDLPEDPESVVRFRRIRLLGKPRLATLPTPAQEDTQTELVAGGLRVFAQTDDPAILFATPWLDTAQVREVEVEMSAADRAKPQLFWHGTVCPHFKEQCSVWLSRVGGAQNLFRADLAGVAAWRGSAPALRFDPDTPAGEFVVKRFRLIDAQGGS